MLSRGAIFYFLAPLVELWVAIKVGAALGAAGTVLALLALSVLGVYLFKATSATALKATLESVTSAHDNPADIVVNQGLGVAAAALLILPGFISGLVGLALLLPPVRSLVKPFVAGRMPESLTSFTGGASEMFRGFGNNRGDVIDVDASESGAPTPTNRSELR